MPAFSSSFWTAPGIPVLYCTSDINVSQNHGHSLSKHISPLQTFPPTMPISDFVQEPSTGIHFPRHFNGFVLIGCGVRLKFGYVKGYAVGTYMEAFKTAAAPNEMLLNPDYARIIRIVMYRAVPIDKFNASITEALTPRMNGDLDQLNKFKELGPRHDLSEGDIIELSIRGDTMEYKNSLGGVGQIKSIIFTRAICNAFYGEDCVSPSHKEAVIKGISSMSNI